jgi:hypothetical protein
MAHVKPHFAKKAREYKGKAREWGRTALYFRATGDQPRSRKALDISVHLHRVAQLLTEIGQQD